MVHLFGSFTTMSKSWIFLIQLLHVFIVVVLLSSCEQKIKEELVYLKSKDENFDLYKSDILGQWEERLTTNPGRDWQPKWNSELKSIIYYSCDSTGSFSVKSRQLRGNLITMPFGEPSDYQLTSDAESIIYTVRDSISSNLWTCKIDGTNGQALTATKGHNGRVAIDPSRNRIAFISDRTGTNEVYTLDLATRALFQLTNNQMIEKYLSWSPDGEQLAITMKGNKDDKEDIFIINSDGAGLKQLTYTPYPEQEIAWSLSGDKIAFHGTSESDGDQIYTINLKTGSFVKVTSGDFYHGEPCWIPKF